ncbi:MAG TPA: HAD family phosphatase [Sedimentisphaerales bacterium]|nr:HAD family phosphatase [Sedimentisphaerales bacterium]
MAKPRSQMGVIFDLDGVLIDSSEFHKQSWFDLAEKEGFEMTDEFFCETFGMQNYQIIPMLAKRDMSPEEIDRLAQWKEQRYRDLIEDAQILAPGADALLADLKRSGFLLAIGSSAPRKNMDFVLERIGVGHYFDAIVTGEDVKEGKPAPDTFLKAAERLSLPPDRCVVVEDAVAGVQAARNAGMRVIALATTRPRKDLTEADLVADSLADLTPDDFINLIEDPTP